MSELSAHDFPVVSRGDLLTGPATIAKSWLLFGTTSGAPTTTSTNALAANRTVDKWQLPQHGRVDTHSCGTQAPHACR